MAAAPTVRPALPQAHLDKLREITRQLARLGPDYQNPERFYRKRDDLVDDLDALGRKLGCG